MLNNNQEDLIDTSDICEKTSNELCSFLGADTSDECNAMIEICHYLRADTLEKCKQIIDHGLNRP